MRLTEALRAIIAIEKQQQRPGVIPMRRVEAGAAGRGFADPRQREGTRRIAMTLDEPTFQRVRAHASARNISFAAAARELIELGVATKASAQ